MAAPENQPKPGTLTPEEALENYYYFTGKASDVIRQLGLAAVALVWLFKVDVAGRPQLPEILLVAAQWAVVSLALDLLQYLYGAAAWGIFHGIKERSGVSEFQAPRPINWLTIAFFWGKAISMVVSYVYILRYIAAALSVF